MIITRQWLPAGLALAFGLGGPRLGAQEVECDLRGVGSEITGWCSGFDDTPVGLTLRRGDGDLAWSGTMTFGEQSVRVEVARYQYDDGPALVLRTPFGWVLLSVLGLDDDPPRLAWSFADEAPPSRTDLAILERARDLLQNESAWDRADDRVCSPEDKVYSLYCAMAEGVRRVTGGYQHRQPALQIVRRVVATRWEGRVVNHRLMDFNNDPATTFADILTVFAEARAELLDAMR